MDETAMTPAALSAENISKAFDGNSVLDALSVSIDPGKTLAILGRSGSGKSTLLKCLNLTFLPDKGEISLDGQAYFQGGAALFEPWEVRRQIGLVLQEYPLFPNLTVRQNLAFALRHNLQCPPEEVGRRIEPIAGQLGITALFDRYPGTLSGGQAQRCALARALVLKPRVLLLDEITSALDPETINDVIAAVRSLRAAAEDQTLAIVLVTHLVHFAETFADEIAFLHQGALIERHPAAAFSVTASRGETRRFLEANLYRPG